MNIHLSSSENPIVAFRKKILNPKSAYVPDLFTECNNRLFRLSWLHTSDPVLHAHRKVTITFHPIDKKLPGYIWFSKYMVSVTACPFTLTSVESNSHLNQTTHKDARLRSAATAGCFETYFSICWYVYIMPIGCKRDYKACILVVRPIFVLDEY